MQHLAPVSIVPATATKRPAPNPQPVFKANLSTAESSATFQDQVAKEAVMPHMKKANAVDQLHAMKSVIKSNKQHIAVLDIGGGDGLTAPVMKEVRDKKANVSILYVEPDATKPRENELTYLERYSLAHEAAGVDIKQVLEKKTQDLTVSDVKEVFPSGADVVFASHSMYFEMDDIWAASNQAPDFDNAKLVGEWVEKHPLTKYLDALANGGVFVVTLGSAQELGTIRSIVLGNHNLSLDSDPLAPKDAKGLGCLKNMQFFAKHLACFKPYYEMHRQCKIEGINKTYSTTTQVPLGRYEVSFNRGTGLYDVHNPTDQAPEHFHAPAVFRYYCGWPIAEEVQAMDESQIASTMKKQEMFLRLLPYFQQGMHLNLRDETMSIRISQ